MNERNTLLYKKYISLSHFILERGTQFVVSLRDRWRDIYSEKGLLLAPYLLPGARGCQRLHPLASRIVRDDLTPLTGCVSLARFPILPDWLSKSDLVVLISRGLLLVTHLLDRPTLTHCHPLFTNHNVTACQSTRGHQEWTQIHVNSHYITLMPVGKVWIQLLSSQLWGNSREDWVLQPWHGKQSRRRKTLKSNLLNFA